MYDLFIFVLKIYNFDPMIRLSDLKAYCVPIIWSGGTGNAGFVLKTGNENNNEMLEKCGVGSTRKRQQKTWICFFHESKCRSFT